MRVHFVVHESYEAPGAFEVWARKRGYTSTYSRVYLHEPLPDATDEIDLLVVLGGPQSPTTTRERCPHFDAEGECDLIRRCVDGGTKVVGVCLGAQLIGTALGGTHERSPKREIGVFPIHLTDAGKKDSLLCDFESTLPVGHWHNDMPGLTEDAVILAYSEGCPRQIVRYRENVYGFQCHMELTPDVVELLITATGDGFQKLRDEPFVQQPDALRGNEYGGMNERLFGFLDRLMGGETGRC